MRFTVDSHFVIGKTHVRENKPCQDHAQHAQKEQDRPTEAAVICVSDGCSGGGRTDIGSRVITLSTIRAVLDRNLRVELNPDNMGQLICDSVNTYSLVSRTALGISNMDMLATSIYAVVNQQSGYVHMMGDGVCAIKYIDGVVEVIELNWQNNMPYYPIYREYDTDNFIAKHREHKNGEEAMKVTAHIIAVSGEVVTSRSRYVDIETAMKGHIIELNLHSIESLTIFSDGITDFQDEKKNAIHVTEAVDGMLSFRNYNGEFVKRRVTAGLQNFAKQGIVPSDDFSMATIHIDHSDKAI